MTELPFQVVFVGGAARSGTTMINSLLCSSQKTNAQIKECSYIQELMAVYFRRKNIFHAHDEHYFNDEKELFEFHKSMIKDLLLKTWERVGKPEILVLKSPGMVLFFQDLYNFFPDAKFVITYRNPFDVVLSRMEVMKKAGLQKITSEHIKNISKEFKEIYEIVIYYLNAVDRSRFLLIDYDRFVSEKPALDFINEFIGVDDIRYEKLWSKQKDSFVEKTETESNPWRAELAGKSVSDEHVGRGEKMLSWGQKRIVRAVTGGIDGQMKKIL